MSRVKEVESDEALTDAMRAAPADSVVIVDFSASWCGPCQMIAPVFAQLSVKYPQATFIKVNADRCPLSKAAMQVTAFPTFIFCKPGNPLPRILGKFSGADANQLEARIQECLSASSGASAAAAAAAAGPVPGQQVIDEYVDTKSVECLNQKESNPVANIFTSSDTFLESDADEQLIVSMGFSCPVRIHSIAFKCTFTAETAPDASGPKVVKLFANQQAMDFDDAESQAPVQTLTLTQAQLDSGEPVPLKYVKFQNINTLSLFIQDNQGGTDTTALTQLTLYGQTRDKTNMSEFKRVAGEANEGE
eukprot:m.176566 g.176566  ORF g.176566 m.176566 type:complete len:305 (-) comp14197_c0_seq1:37-951(-)